MLICLLMSSCHSSKQAAYPGFTEIAARTSVPYFINKDEVQTDSNDVVSYTVVVPQKNGQYQMLRMATNCSSAVASEGGTLYESDGKISRQIDADKQPIPLDKSSDMGKVAANACQIALEKRSFSGAFDIRRALPALFGNYDPSKQFSSVKVKTDTGTEDGKLIVLLDSPFSQEKIEKHLIVTSTSVPSEMCHACGARIGVFILASREGRWAPKAADRNAFQFGAFGNAGTAQAARFAPGVYGFALALGDMHQGIGDTTELFVAPVGNHYQPVLTLNTEEDNSGQCGPPKLPACYKNSSTVRFLNSSHTLFDIEVDETGTDYTDHGIVPADHERLYLFDGTRYVEQASSREQNTPSTN
jgi:hypothetical protein